VAERDTVSADVAGPAPPPRESAAPAVAFPAEVLSLQRSAGNAVIGRALRAGVLRAPLSRAPRMLQRYDFTRQNYPISSSPATVIKESAENKQARIDEPVSDYCNAILKDAGFDPPSTWYDNFTAITFLGFAVAPPIHVDLATHLKDTEKKLAEDYGGPDKKPAEAAKALGITSIGGSRDYPTSAALSMHLFGLAIDVNYTANPFISTSANKVFARAGLLIGEKNVKFVSRPTAKFEEIAWIDNVMQAYFAFLDDDKGLEAALGRATDPPWKGMAVDAAKKQIQADLDEVAGRWERSKPAQKAVIKAGGITDLDRRFVDGIGLHWGAAYGDIMHFDMRNKGTGATINAAIGRYKNKKEAQASEKWAADHPG
jgi:hypothetical protein